MVRQAEQDPLHGFVVCIRCGCMIAAMFTDVHERAIHGGVSMIEDTTRLDYDDWVF